MRMQRNYRQQQHEPMVKEFEEKIVQVNRTSKKTQGGNQIGFSVLVVVGDKKGRVGVGLGKAHDVASAVNKATNYAKHHFIAVPIVHGTIPHEVFIKWGAAKVLLKPAREGTGIIAGGAVRAVVETAGIANIVSKMLGTNNKTSNVYATMEALKELQLSRWPYGARQTKSKRGKTATTENTKGNAETTDKENVVSSVVASK